MSGATPSPRPSPKRVVIYFDGVCNLCNHFIDFLIRHDRKRHLRYASQQGSQFQALLAAHPHFQALSTFITVVTEGDRETIHIRSDASLTALAQLPSPWKWLSLFRVVPSPIRDVVYNWVARHRYRLFGKRESCRLPSPEERALFLD